MQILSNEIAAIVGNVHLSASNHWATLGVLAKTCRWTSHKLVGLSLPTGVGHVTLSIVLGFVLVEVSSITSDHTSALVLANSNHLQGRNQNTEYSTAESLLCK